MPPPDKLVGALSSGLAVLRYLAASTTPVGVSRITRDLELNASTCFNLLKTLVHEGLVVFDDATKTYTIGIGLVELARGALEQAAPTRMLRPHLQAVARDHAVTAQLWQQTPQDRVVLIDSADNPATIRIHVSIGQRLPLYLAALGRCMAAYSELPIAQLRARIDAMRWENKPSFEDYWAEVELVRQRGYAVDDGHYVRGVTAVSAPIVDADGRASMALSAVGFSAQLDEAAVRALGADLHSRAADISRALSGRSRS